MILTLFALAAVSDCDAAARLSGLDYRQCLCKVEKRADAEMVSQWRLTLAGLRKEDAENRREKANKPILVAGLLDSQRAWLKYRDAECNMVSSQAAGGTGYGELGAECSITLTRHRTEILRRRVDGLVRYLR
ncbi:lysozyme inhibitor LprI family protein [Sphingomonas sp.]|uniref:lysozyme inhibitor LprI family protein n=1 Tax=unclassified Sphingomonas TaxID=196159 RepID=UPI003863D031